MTKKITLALVALIILAIGGYSALWFTQAKLAQEQVTQAIAAMNQPREVLRYESITLAGFPGKVGVAVNKPTLIMPLSDVLKPLATAMPVAPDGTDISDLRRALLAMPNWHEEVMLDGHVLITVDALSNTYRITPSGNYTGKSQLGDKNWNYSINATGGERGCEVAFNSGIASDSFVSLWNWDTLSQDPAVLVKNLKSLNCSLPAIEMANSDAQNIYSSQPGLIYFANASQGEVLDVQFDVNFPSLTATPAYDSWMETYYTAIYGKVLPDYYRLSLYGKQAMRMKGSLKMNESNPAAMPLTVHLEELSYQSDIVNSRYTFRVHTTPKGNMAGDAEVVSSINVKANEKGYQLYRSQAVDLAHDYYGQLPPPANENVTPEQLGEAFSGLVPKLHELGDIAVDVDVMASAEEAGKTSMQIRNLAFSTDPYGLKANGALDLASVMIPIPSGKVDLACRQCPALVNDAIEWSARLKPVMLLMEPDATYPAFMDANTSELKSAVVNFLRKLDPAANDDFTFKLAMTAEGAFSVNGLDTVKLLGYYNEHLAPFLAGQTTGDSTGDAAAPVTLERPGDAPAAPLAPTHSSAPVAPVTAADAAKNDVVPTFKSLPAPVPTVPSVPAAPAKPSYTISVEP